MPIDKGSAPFPIERGKVMFGLGKKDRTPVVLNLPAAGNGKKGSKVKVKVVQRKANGQQMPTVKTGKHRA